MGAKLNLGCGPVKMEGYINIDINDKWNPEIVCDIEEGFFFEDSSIDEVRAWDFLEHIHSDKVMYVIEEIWRVLKAGGNFTSSTPSTDGRGAFQDPTHKSFWNYNSWVYYMNDLMRDLYDTKAKFQGDVWDEGGASNPPNVIHTRANLFAVK